MEINILSSMHPIIYSYLRQFEISLLRKYDKEHPNVHQKPKHFRGGFKREEFIEILELAFGREIKFTRTYPPEGQEHLYDEISGDISTYKFRYIGNVGNLNPGQQLIKKFYDLAIPYAHKFEYDEHPIMFRDIIGIEKTIALLEEANNRCIEMICNVAEDQESISPDDLEFIILEEDEWYDFETGKVRKEDELED